MCRACVSKIERTNGKWKLLFFALFPPPFNFIFLFYFSCALWSVEMNNLSLTLYILHELKLSFPLFHSSFSNPYCSVVSTDTTLCKWVTQKIAFPSSWIFFSSTWNCKFISARKLNEKFDKSMSFGSLGVTLIEWFF